MPGVARSSCPPGLPLCSAQTRAVDPLWIVNGAGLHSRGRGSRALARSSGSARSVATIAGEVVRRSHVLVVMCSSTWAATIRVLVPMAESSSTATSCRNTSDAHSCLTSRSTIATGTRRTIRSRTSSCGKCINRRANDLSIFRTVRPVRVTPDTVTSQGSPSLAVAARTPLGREGFSLVWGPPL